MSTLSIGFHSMSVVSIFSQASLFLWYMYFIKEIHSTEGTSVICDPMSCSSEEYKLKYCALDEYAKIVSASVATIHSRTKCVNAKDYQSDDNEGIGFYGYDGNILWVDKGCSAKFRICYTGSRLVCDFFTCSSEEYKLQKCILDEDEDISIATIFVETFLSNTICVNAQDYLLDDNAYIGFYGYYDNIIWVDKGCSAEFKICYTAEISSLTYSSSMISNPPTTVSEILTTKNDIDPMSTSAIETTRETSTPTTEFYGTHSQTERHQQQDSSNTTIVIVVVVAVVAGVLVLGIIGIILCRLRYKRKRTIRKESDTVFEKRTETVPPKIHGFKNQKCHQTPTAKTTNEMSAEIQGQLNMYTSFLSWKTLLRKETNENTKLGENERPIPPKRHISKDNANKALVTKPNKANIQAPTNNPAGITDTEVGNEQVEQSDDYLEPVSNRTSLEESANYIELQPEAQVETSPNTAVEGGNAIYTTDEEYHIYDYIDPNNVPDTFS